MNGWRTLTLVGVLAAQPATSPSPEAHSLVARGIVALHNFEYEEANEAFQHARTLDPAEALAYWGEAMTYNQTLWRNENVPAAREALARLAPTSDARAAKAAEPRTRALLGAVEALFGEGDASTRRRLYADAMSRVHAQFPDDPDVAAFYALAMLGTASRSLIGNMDAHDPALAGSETQRRVADVLQRVLASHPNHAGALHYLIHDYDDPEHARLALGAARAYAKVATASSHAQHMPAHVFLQLGFWHDAARSDRAAYDASNAWIKLKQLGPAMRNYHALAWLQYELLQLGRYWEASALIQDLKWVADANGPTTLLSDWSSMRGRFVIETRRWNDLAGADNFGNVDDLFAIGMSTARTGALDRAERVRQVLAQRATAEQEGDLRPAIAIMERELAALIALGAGRRDDAIAILQKAADDEIRLPAPLGLPQPVKPAPELLGEVLLEAGRAADAQKAFERALRRNANRSLSVVGLARASAAQGQAAAARKHYRQLLANFDRADGELTELKEARDAVRTR